MLLPVDTITSLTNSYVDLKENLSYNETSYYRIAGLKEKACDPVQINNNQALSNIVKIHRDPNNVETVNYPDRISISPNPFETETLIKWENSPCGNSDFFLYDLKGTLIKKISDLKKGEYKLQKGNLPSGCYIIEVTGNIRYYGKIFVI